MTDRTVQLRHEVSERSRRNLWARLEGGQLLLEGQDLGEGTELVSGDGEYEWTASYDAAAVLALLGGAPGDDLLALLERDYAGEGSYELERRLRESGLPHTLQTY